MKNITGALTRFPGNQGVIVLFSNKGNLGLKLAKLSKEVQLRVMLQHVKC